MTVLHFDPAYKARKPVILLISCNAHGLGLSKPLQMEKKFLCNTESPTTSFNYFSAIKMCCVFLF